MVDFDDEAKAFDQRIMDRTEHGFIADLRRVQPNEYFYKSFWRHPHYTDLFLGEMFRNYVKVLEEHVAQGARVLDLGCGAGYFSLELARLGYHVVGVDISAKCIETARQILEQNPYKDGFGSVEYAEGSYTLVRDLGQFDAVLCSGFLHHIPDLDEVISIIDAALVSGGMLIWHEPSHKSWTPADAAFVAAIRLILAEAGLWYDETILRDLDSAKLMELVAGTQEEYVLERDPHEAGGQSPNDLSWDGNEITQRVAGKLELLMTKPSVSFIYRVLGGMRGDQEKLNRIASLLTLIDRTYLDEGILNANYFYGVARKT
ncbi:class I SAM-dependent methyltransferase [Nisaea sediminum]|uniref:class I SAM-dependent methyltransferase n=1 Tax=Nisaea sediminum TaxID=2775867 RepID=UPI0018676993|nr:methyltransferase domain-containing protein [Nisaea sediminum]